MFVKSTECSIYRYIANALGGKTKQSRDAHERLTRLTEAKGSQRHFFESL